MNTNYRDFKYAVNVLNVTFDIGLKKIGMGSYLFGRQHAGEGSHHSGRYSSDDMIQGCSMFLNRIYLVEFLYSSMDAIENWLREAFYLSNPDRTPISRNRYS